MPAEGALELLQGVQSAHAAQQAVLGTNAVIHIDTAEIYKTGNMMVDSEEDVYNEQMLAPFLASVPRESFTIATKLLPHKYGGSKSLEIYICT
jgi:aryl-alcohol dehydrogenase-like predicted oxidoreductase